MRRVMGRTGALLVLALLPAPVIGCHPEGYHSITLTDEERAQLKAKFERRPVPVDAKGRPLPEAILPGRR